MTKKEVAQAIQMVEDGFSTDGETANCADTCERIRNHGRQTPITMAEAAVVIAWHAMNLNGEFNNEELAEIVEFVRPSVIIKG